MLLESFRGSLANSFANFQSLDAGKPFRNQGMKRTSVFIIEKDPSVANLVRYQLLSRQANQVQIFPNLGECLYFATRKFVPDFVIADLDQPELQSPDFLKTLREACPETGILLLSSTPDDLLAGRLLEEGATDYIVKTERTEEWMTELTKNIGFLAKEKSKAE
jgi:two-component system, CitB family, response regulator DctR